MKNNGADITLLLCLKKMGWSKNNLGKYLLQYIFSKCEFNFFECDVCYKKVYWSNLYICLNDTICASCLEPNLDNNFFCYYDISSLSYVEIFYGRIIITFLKETLVTRLFSSPLKFNGEKSLKFNGENQEKKKRLILQDKFLLQHFDQYKKIVCGCKAVQNYIHTKFLE